MAPTKKGAQKKRKAGNARALPAKRHSKNSVIHKFINNRLAFYQHCVTEFSGLLGSGIKEKDEEGITLMLQACLNMKHALLDYRSQASKGTRQSKKPIIMNLVFQIDALVALAQEQCQQAGIKINYDNIRLPKFPESDAQHPAAMMYFIKNNLSLYQSQISAFKKTLSRSKKMTEKRDTKELREQYEQMRDELELYKEFLEQNQVENKSIIDTASKQIKSFDSLLETTRKHPSA